MIRKYLALACLAIACMACTPDLANNVASSGPPANTGVASRTMLDERLLYAAEAAYNVPAQAYVVANSRGQVSPELKARVKPLLTQAYARLQDARRLYALGNADGFLTAYRQVIALATSARSLIPGAPPMPAQPDAPATATP